MLKSVAVVAGSYILSIILVIASDPLLTLLFPGDFVRDRVPSDAALTASTALFIVASTFCAWVCARFAPSRPDRHVIWFAVIGEAMGLFATISNWNKGWPHWYFVSWMIAWPIACFLGWRLSPRPQPVSAGT